MMKTTTGTNKTLTNMFAGLVSASFVLGAVANVHAHDVPPVVRDRYAAQKRDLHKAYAHDVRSMNAEYQATLVELTAARRSAVRLCEPARGLALADIRAARIGAVRCYQDDLLTARKRRKLALADLEAWYANACRVHTHTQTVVRVPVAPTYVVKETRTYRVPTPRLVVEPQVVVEPRVIVESPPVVVETPQIVFPETTVAPPAPELNYEVIEPPVLEAPTGPIPEAVLPELDPWPTTSVEVVPAVPVRTVTTTTTKVTLTKVVPAVATAVVAPVVVPVTLIVDHPERVHVKRRPARRIGHGLRLLGR